MKLGGTCSHQQTRFAAGDRPAPRTGCGSWLCECPVTQAVRCPHLVGCLDQSSGRLQQMIVPEVAPRWKRWLDMTAIVLTAPAWVPLMLAVAVLIKCVSRGPVFFRQERVGFRGGRFTMLKFRTMEVNADTAIHQEHFESLVRSGRRLCKLDSEGDPRLIPCGEFLRAAGLDELPQLLNVLRGEMSLVGPRPCTPHEASLYAEWHKKRFAALPGLTGMWQVCGKNRTTFNQMISLDIYYATGMRLSMDLKIMLRTALPLFQQVKGLLSHRRRVAAAEEENERTPVMVFTEQRLVK